MIDDDDNEAPFCMYSSAIQVVSSANMASEKELKEAIKALNRLIGTGYYDDKEGDRLLEHVVAYLTGKLNNQGNE
jgi:hypothetical protein